MNEKALDIAERIVDRARAINETSVNVFVYSKLLQGFCFSNQRKEAFALLAVCTCHSSETCIWVFIMHPRSCRVPQTRSVLNEDVLFCDFPLIN